MKAKMLEVLEFFVAITLVAEKILYYVVGMIILIIPTGFFLGHAISHPGLGYGDIAISILVGFSTLITGADILYQTCRREIIVISW